MGGRRLPGEKIAAGAALLAGLAVLAAACGSSAGGTGTTAATASSNIETADVSPVATPTPDVLASGPEDWQAAQSGLESELRASGEACPERLRTLWKVRCATGDLDGDGTADNAYLVPFKGGGASSYPAAVFVMRSNPRAALERLRFEGDADASRMGQEFFTVANRTGDSKRMELSILSASCGATSCSYQVHIEMWDGTAWRDIGPEDSVTNLDRVGFSADAKEPELVTHGGLVNSPGAGPTRASTVTYAFNGHRFSRKSVQADPPVYLYHAIRDADAQFNAGDFTGAIAAYKSALADPKLRDWQKETRNIDGRAGLESYALFRIAVATAASGADATAAIDATILDAKDALFRFAAERFRNGLLDRGTVTAGCAAATAYLSITNASADNPAHLREVFDYGYANLPAIQPKDVCPL